MSITKRAFLTLSVLIVCCVSAGYAAKCADVQVIDREYLLIHVLDGEMRGRDDGSGPNAFTNSYHETDYDTVKTYAPALNTTGASVAENWTVTSPDDATFGSTGLHPQACYRKTKMNGQAEQEWSGNDYLYAYTYEHYLYLKLPSPLQQGKNYSLAIAEATNIITKPVSFTYDIFQSRSEAIHINLAGYHPDPTIKSADLYIWMGDGKARDYKSFEGNKVYLYNVTSKQSTETGAVTFWKASGNDIYSYNLTRSAVWNADFSGFTTPGTYRLAIEGIGCSQDFTIAENAYHDPFMVSVQGFFYMRIGQDSTANIKPVPRRPLYIPGVSPANTTVYLTTMHPYHAEWGSFSSGDVWDKPADWVKFKKTGNPVNARAYGGHSDALDWDRHLGHISIIWDMLLPYFLTSGAISDDNLDIAESGNGIPDIIDEARNEVDFWLRLRDGEGFSHGLTNPTTKNELFQAAPTAIAAWANAANAAMLADCFRIAGKTDLQKEYRDSAVAAYTHASNLPDKMLDKTQGIGDFTIRGRDLKMMAAAFLYNCTGDTAYEKVIQEESVVTSATSKLENAETMNQLWATAAYLLTQQPVHYTTLHANMKASIISQAKTKEASLSSSRPSRRATAESSWYFRTAQNVHHCIIAHAVSDNDADRSLFRKAMVLEADYGLGRNPMNMIQMTTASTPLESKRSVEMAYTTGGDDGTPGLHPGHTPYFNLDDWDVNMTMGSPSKLYQNCYPANFLTTWPIDEGYFNTRYVWAHNEFTPQQTMRGKMALYGYLYGITRTSSSGARAPHFSNSPTKSSVHPTAQNSRMRVLDLNGRVIWSGTAGARAALPSSLPMSQGVYLIERIVEGTRSVSRCIVRE